MDADFVKKEAKWYKASLPYDNLSKLPPKTLTNPQPGSKEALEAFQNYYFTSTDAGLEANLKAGDYVDPWPILVKKKTKTKKKEEPLEDDITAGIPPKDREAFNEELQSFMQEYCPSETEDLPNPIVTKTLKAEKAKKAADNREKRAAAKAKLTMAPSQHTRNTRLRAKAANAAIAADDRVPAHDALATQDAANTTSATGAEDDTVRSRLQSAPPVISFMRDTRAAMTRNAFMSRPLRGVVSNSYYAASSNGYPKAKSLGDEPIGNDIPGASSHGQVPAESKPELSNTAAPKKAGATKKAAPPEKSAPPKKSAQSKTAAAKTAAAKAAATKAASTMAASTMAASTKVVDSSLGDDKAATSKPRRAAKACDPCRAHKTRCTGGTPCDACVRRGFDCVYVSGGRKAPMKRAREEDQKAVKTEPSDKDADHDDRPAKRARKEETTSTKKRAREEDQKAVNIKPFNKDADQDGRAAKRARKEPAFPAKKKDLVQGSEVKGGETSFQPSEILPSIEEVPEESDGANPEPSKLQPSSLEVPENGAKAKAQPTNTQSFSRGRITRSRSRQMTEEAEAEAAKLQHKGKRAHEETDDALERPAKLQRSSSTNGTFRKPDGNSQILKAINSHQVDSEGHALKNSHWDGWDWEPTWMGHMWKKWEEQIDYPNFNLRTQDESFHTRPSIKLVMTDILKGILVDDWEHVTKDSQLVPLPHAQPVVKILNDYLEDEMPKREEDSAQIDILKETMAGLREYFDRALGRILLYR